MWTFGLKNRKVNFTSESGGEVCVGTRGVLSRTFIRLLLVVLVCLGVNPVAFAKCGSSSRHMLWKNASNSELIRLNKAIFIPSALAKADSVSVEMTSAGHDADRPCSTCRCKNDKEPATPIESFFNETVHPPICRFCEAPEWVLVARLDSQIANLGDSFLCPALGQLEKPPIAACL